MTAGRKADRLMQQIREFRPQVVASAHPGVLTPYKEELSRLGVEVLEGEDGICQVAAYEEAELVVSAISGIAGLLPTMAALRAGKTVALANKETLVTAGQLVRKQLNHTGARLLPVDSEHSAIVQCLEGRSVKPYRLWLTASGGPFRGYTREQLARVTKEEALRHPTWNMGTHITIDSATLLNKGLEIIEAHWLFDMPYEKIEVVIHPESIVHSLVELEDGAFLAQLGAPDMRQAIQYALLGMTHRPPYYAQKRLLPTEWGKLHFEEIDRQVFDGLQLAIDAGRSGGTQPTVLNAAKEVAVQAFLDDRISFLQITQIIRHTLEMHTTEKVISLDDVLAADAWARRTAATIIKEAE